VPEDAECMDIVGRPVAARPIPISTAVVYLTGPAGSAQKLMESVSLIG